ncbi:hypothetical protein C0J52_20032 [Blattella germanica]|nr:hypothetical protein C0J52_20032 [Blattella germanica]
MEYRVPIPCRKRNQSTQMEIKKHIPSRLTINGHTAQISYTGQEMLCFICQEPNHKKDECPNKKTTMFVNTQPRRMLLSDVVKGAENGKEKEKTNVMNMDVESIQNETTIDDETDTASEDEATKSETKQNKKHKMETLIMQE